MDNELMKNDELDKKVKVVSSETASLISNAQAITIKTAEDVGKASTLGSEISRRLKNIEEQRVSFVKPLNDHVAGINAKFKTVSVPLGEAKIHLANIIGIWQTEERERIQKEEDRRNAIAKKAEEKRKEKDPVKFKPAEEIKIEAPKTSIGSSQTKLVWKGTVVDVSKLPAEYIVANNVAINMAIRGGVRDIPGVKIEQIRQVGFN